MQPTLRMRHVGLASLCCGLGLLLTNLSFAQQPGAEPATRPQPQAQQQQAGEKKMCLATDLIGMSVKAKGEQAVGQIRNLVINANGEVQYLALSTQAPTATDRAQPQPDAQIQQQQDQNRLQARTADATGKLTLVPWEMAKFHPGETPTQSFVSVEIEKDRLIQAPSFTQQQLTTPQAQAQLTAQVDEFFNLRERRRSARPDLERDRTQPDQNRDTNPQRQDN